MGATVTLLTPAVVTDPGVEVTVEMRLRNTGAVVDEFALDVLGESAGWAVVDPPTLSLFPGAEETARITFRPPRASSTPAGQLPFGLRARSREDPAGSTVEEGVIEIGAFVEPYAELVPRTSRGSGGASHELAVDNRGNARLSAEVEGSDADRLLGFDVTPPAVVVEPGMAGFAKVRVKPVKRFWRGQPKARPFQLFVTAEGQAPITLDGTMLQEAILPSWFGRLVAAVLLAVIAAVVLWLLVLKPTIQSAASDSVADLRDKVDDAMAQAGLPTLAPADGGGGEPTPAGQTPNPSAGSGGPAASLPVVIPGLGNPVDGRLDAKNPTVKRDGTLFVTDLIFSNPNGRKGTIQVFRGEDQLLLQLELENFRDYDLHFVTPIVIAGEQLKVGILACDPLAPGDCDAAVFYSGYLRP